MTLWDDDDQLMQELREAHDGAVSEEARTTARAAFAWRTIDEELMRLTHDSSLAEEVLVRRDGRGARVLGFEGSGLTLEIEVDGDTLMGQVVPGRSCRVSMVSPPGEVRTVETDPSGVFSLPAPARSPVRLAVEDAGTTQTTEWLSL